MLRPAILFAAVLVATSLPAQKPRARELGLSTMIGGVAGPLDAITDVAGVEVGHTTLISGSGKLVVGKGPVRTGVTAILPRGKRITDPVFAAWFTLNGNGEMTGTTWIRSPESSKARSRSRTRTASASCATRSSSGKSRDPEMQPWGLPVVAETYDGCLNDINGFHVKPEHVLAALDSATAGRCAKATSAAAPEWSVIGSRAASAQRRGGSTREVGGYTVGVLVQCNYGLRRDLRVAGVPVGQEIPDLLPCVASADPSRVQRSAMRRGAATPDRRPTEQGSIIVVVATDAPLLPHQLKRLVTRVALGVGRSGRVRRQRLGRHLRRVLDRQRRRRARHRRRQGRHAAQRADECAVLGDGASDRGGDSQRAPRRRDDDRGG